MENYTIEMFENDLKNHKNRILIRNGEFVGLYRYEDKTLFIYRALNQKSYRYKEKIKMQESGPYWGGGGSIRENTLIFVNEAHFVPKGFDFRKKKDLEFLDKCLGGSHSQVQDRLLSYVDRNPGYKIRMFDPNEKGYWIYKR